MQKSKRFSLNLVFLQFSIIFIFIVSLPEMITWETLPDGLIFNGVFVNIDDANVYMSAIRQGSEGKWMFNSQFTSEFVPDIISYFPYIFTGKFLSIFGGSVFLWYQILRFGALVFCLYATAKVSEEVFPDQKNLQNTSFLLMLFGSGISWIIMIFENKVPIFAAELVTPEWNLVTASLSAPHFLFGIGFQIFFFIYLNRILLNPTNEQVFRLLAIGIFLGLTYPFLIPLDGLVIAVYIVFDAIRKKAIPWNNIFKLLISTFPMILILLYYGYYIPNDHTLSKTLLINNQIAAPNLDGILVGYGILLLFAAFGVKTFSTSHLGRIIIIWMISNLFCFFLPLSFAGRLVLALYIPICLMAGQGIEIITNSRKNIKYESRFFSPTRRRRFLTIITFPSTLLFLILSINGPKSNPGYPYYYLQNEISVVKWLSTQTNEHDIILADYPMSNLIPRYSSAKVFLGHLNLTINLDSKIYLLRKFLDPETNQNWRSEFIEQWGITYIYLGQYEQKVSSGSFIPPGKLVYDQDGIKVFHISP